MKFLCTLKNALLIIRDRFGLSFAWKGLGYLADILLLLSLLSRYNLSCYQTTLLLTISALADITLLKTTCHFLLLLVGFDTLTYGKHYDRSPILVVISDSHNNRSSMFDVFVCLHQNKRVDVLHFMFYQLCQCVQENKSLIYAPFIQTLIESVCPTKYISQYKTPIPKRNSNWTPAAPAPYVPPKKDAILGLKIRPRTLLVCPPLLGSLVVRERR